MNQTSKAIKFGWSVYSKKGSGVWRATLRIGVRGRHFNLIGAKVLKYGMRY